MACSWSVRSVELVSDAEAQLELSQSAVAAQPELSQSAVDSREPVARAVKPVVEASLRQEARLVADVTVMDWSPPERQVPSFVPEPLRPRHRN